MGGIYSQDFRAMIDSVATSGTAGEVAAKLQRFYDAGARHFVFLPADPADPFGPAQHFPCVRGDLSRLTERWTAGDGISLLL